MTEEVLPAEPCAYDPADWQRGSFPGVDACEEDAEPGSEFCTAHNPDNL